jgi:hypothetical protein
MMIGRVEMDIRDRAAKWGSMLKSLPNLEVDPDKMTAIWWSEEEEEGRLGSEKNPYKLRMKYAVCGVCNGRGKHVNPSIDSHGLSSEDFDNDPDFAEDYFSGVYDVTCYECNGRTTILEISENTESSSLQATEDWLADETDYRRTVEHEERYGC